MEFPESRSCYLLERPTEMIYLIIPVYNEAENLSTVLEAIAKLGAEYVPVLVNDGSTDQTGTVAESWQVQHSELMYRSHYPNRGVGPTFLSGIQAVLEQAEDNDAAIIIEGDGTSDLGLLPAISKLLTAGAGIVIASRYQRGGGYRNFPWQRTIGSKMVNWYLKLRCRVRGVSDYTIFYRGYRVGLLRKAYQRYSSKLITVRSFAANLELLLKLARFRPRIAEVPLVYDYGLKKGVSKMNIKRTLLEYGTVIRRSRG